MAEFSVLMPAFNYGRFVGEAIESVLNQSFGDFELIVVDSGSSDHTWDVIASYHDSRLISFHTGWESLTQGLSRALDRASGTWVTNLNADDRFLPNALEMVHARLRNDTSVGVLGVHLRTIDAGGQELDDSYTQSWVNTVRDLNRPEAWIWHNYLTGCAFIRRSTLIEVGGYGDLDTILDWDLWVRALASGSRIDVLPEVLWEWRRHGANITGNQDLATVCGYAQLSRQTLHPYLTRLGREDLITRNRAGFLTNEVLAQAETTVRRDVLRAIFSGNLLEEIDESLQLVTEEVARLRSYYVSTAEHVKDLTDRQAELLDERRETDREIQALTDRLLSAEVDRRTAQEQLRAIRERRLYRAARKAANVFRRPTA
jgi:hypothetical protein